MLVFTEMYKNWELVNRLRLSVHAHTKFPYDFVVYDNEPRNDNLSVVWNRIGGMCPYDYFCHLDSDTKVESGWLGGLMRAGADRGIGVVGPLTNNPASLQGQLERSDDPEVRDWEGVSGFCMLIRKEAWEDVGGFNEKGIDYGIEPDFMRRLNGAGWRTVIARNVFIWHEGGATRDLLGQDRSELHRKSVEAMDG